MIATAEGGNMNEKTELYELAFNLVPSIPEADVAKEVASIRSMLEKAGGAIKLSEGPKLIPLTYSMEKRMAGKKDSYDTAHFGSFAFEITAEAVPALHTAIAGLPTVLRYLLVNIPREALNPRERPVVVSTGYSHDPKKGAEKPEGVTAAPLSEAELDKTIEGLVVE